MGEQLVRIILPDEYFEVPEEFQHELGKKLKPEDFMIPEFVLQTWADIPRFLSCMAKIGIAGLEPQNYETETER